MSFIRPAARAVLWKWREVLVGGALLLIASWWAVQSFDLLRWVAIAFCSASVLLILAGIQRARFRGAGEGQGVVQVDEGQVIYFGPLDGGAMAIGDIGTLSLDHRARPAHWHLVSAEGPVLSIPVDARGSDALFDAFSGLPGLKTERMLAALNQGETGQKLIWRRADVQAHVIRLH